MTLAVVAVGGNALTQANQVGTIEEQYANATATCRALAKLIHSGLRPVITHGNGPQVGNVLRRVELSRHQVYPLPLDVCDADTQGGIGYMLQQVLGNELQRIGLKRTVVTLITQVLVRADDPGFSKPDKPVGPFYNKEDAEARMAEGWQMREDAGRGFRRVVPSPQPRRIIELDAILSCVENGLVTIAVGGGGIPVVELDGTLLGVEAVVDKDRASSLLARSMGAELFIITTGVSEVQVHFGTPQARTLRRVSRDEIRAYLEAGEFPPGSMGPKIEAALAFLDSGRGRVIITSAPQLEEAIAGRAGTHIR